MHFDEVITELGAFGPYQRRVLLLVLYPCFLYSMYTMIPVFILTDHTHTCNSYGNASIGLSSNSSLVTAKQTCHIGYYDNFTNLTSELACTSWVFDTGELISTPISDFQLVCENAIMKSHIGMAFFLGVVVSFLFVAAVGDSLGRKPVACIIMLFLCFSVGSAWAPNVYVFAALRFLTGIGCNVGQIKILVIEIVGPSWRAFAAILPDVIYTLAELTLCCLAFFIRDWKTLQIVVAVPSVLCLLYPFVLPESVRWLHAKGKDGKTMNSLRRMSRSNSTTLPDALQITKELKPPSVMSELKPLFQSRRLLVRWIVNTYTWFVCGFLFAGLSLNLGTLGGNVYLNFSICVLTELASQMGCLCLSNRLRRKAVIVFFFAICSILCFILIFTTLYLDTVKWYWLLAVATILIRICISDASTILFTYTSELFPTSIRSFFISAANVSYMSGGMIAPYIAYMNETVDVSYRAALPAIVYASVSISGGLLNLNLPETLNKPMPQVMTDLTNEADNKTDNNDPVWSTKL